MGLGQEWPLLVEKKSLQGEGKKEGRSKLRNSDCRDARRAQCPWSSQEAEEEDPGGRGRLTPSVRGGPSARPPSRPWRRRSCRPPPRR